MANISLHFSAPLRSKLSSKRGAGAAASGAAPASASASGGGLLSPVPETSADCEPPSAIPPQSLKSALLNGAKLPSSDQGDGSSQSENSAETAVTGVESSSNQNGEVLKGSPKQLSLELSNSLEISPGQQNAASNQPPKSRLKDKSRSKDVPAAAPTTPTGGAAPVNSLTSSSEKRSGVATKIGLPFGFFNKKKQTDDLLIRLFNSDVFDASLAMSYLFSSKEQGVLDFIGNKLFEFPEHSTHFYLPQMLNLYANVPQVAVSIEKYIKSRCSKSVDFSLTTAWLLSALVPDAINPKKKLSRGAKMRRSILEEQFRSNPVRAQPQEGAPSASKSPEGASVVASGPATAGGHPGHHRSRSAAAFNLSELDSLHLESSSLLGDLQSGAAFNSGCSCFDSSQSIINDLKGDVTECTCGAPRLAGELEFVSALLAISKRLQPLQSRDARTSRLLADLALINLNLPARVWVPNSTQSRNHHVVRIPHTASFVLNSKEKAPYLVYFEVIECGDKFTSPLPQKRLENSLRTTKSVENITAQQMGEQQGSDSVAHSPTSIPPSLTFNQICDIHIDDTDEEGHFYVGDLGLSIAHNSATGGSPHPLPAAAVPHCVMGAMNGVGGGCAVNGMASTYETASLFSHDSIASCDSREQATFIPASDIRRRLSQNSMTSNGTFRSDPDDPSAAALKEPWEAKVARIRENSPYGDHPNWKLVSMIIKVGDDLRLELLASQFIRYLQHIWQEENVPLKVCPVNVLVTSPDSGFIEPLLNTVSLHQIKKQHHTLPEYFRKEFGAETTETYLTAQLNFVKSVAAYSLICYLLQVKDRHNGNILLDNQGHIIHIDYGYLLNSSPKNLGFESSAFKLTIEYVEIMGGVNSDLFNYYKLLMIQGLIATRKHCDKLVQLFEMMMLGNCSPFARHGASSIKALRDRFLLNKTDEQLQLIVESLVESSYHSISTALYDRFQYMTNGIL